MNSKKKEEKSAHVYIANTDKDRDLLQYRPVLPLGRTPYEKQNRNCLLTIAKMWS